MAERLSNMKMRFIKSIGTRAYQPMETKSRAVPASMVAVLSINSSDLSRWTPIANTLSNGLRMAFSHYTRRFSRKASGTISMMTIRINLY